MDAKSEGKILIVDDDRGALQILKSMLEKEGFEAIAADSGARAIELARTRAIDVVVLDVMMPDMDGLQVCKELRAADVTHDLPVILLTAKDDVETRVAGMKLGVSEFVAKPINKRDLFARLRIHQRTIEHGIDRMLSE
jgi:DNA-binding response OmpR family regulator